jgi:hypothetical protein
MLTLLLERVLLASSEHAHAHGKKDVKESDDEAQILKVLYSVTLYGKCNKAVIFGEFLSGHGNVGVFAWVAWPLPWFVPWVGGWVCGRIYMCECMDVRAMLRARTCLCGVFAWVAWPLSRYGLGFRV